MTRRRVNDPFPDDPAEEAAALLRFTVTEPDRFRTHPVPSGLLRLYGGQIVAQALGAMRATVPAGKLPHALHLFYQRPGLTDRPLDLAVTRDTDGRSFAQRRVAVTQDGAPIAYAMASFQAPEDSRATRSNSRSPPTSSICRSSPLGLLVRHSRNTPRPG